MHGTGVRMRKHFEIIYRSKVVRKNCTNNPKFGLKAVPNGYILLFPLARIYIYTPVYTLGPGLRTHSKRMPMCKLGG